MADLLTQAQYAAHRGCTQPYISRLVREGRIPTVAGKIDPVLADAALEQSSDPGKVQGSLAKKAAKAAAKAGQALPNDVPAGAEGATGREQAAEAAAGAPPDRHDAPAARKVGKTTFTDVRTRRELALAQQAELDYRRSVGQLCEIEAVTRAVSDCSIATRRLVEQIPNRIASRLAAAFGADVRKVQPMMQEEIERVCDEIANTATALPERLKATRQ